MDACLVKHQIDQFISALSDISGTVKFCEKRIWDASCDHTMKEETEDLLNGSARTLSLIARLIDWELEEMEKLAMQSQPGGGGMLSTAQDLARRAKEHMGSALDATRDKL